MKQKITLIVALSLGVFGCFMVVNAMTKDSPDHTNEGTVIVEKGSKVVDIPMKNVKKDGATVRPKGIKVTKYNADGDGYDVTDYGYLTQKDDQLVWRLKQRTHADVKGIFGKRTDYTIDYTDNTERTFRNAIKIEE